ncbi:unnamed protein product, partial [Closterium sp. NIES-53]
LLLPPPIRNIQSFTTTPAIHSQLISLLSPSSSPLYPSPLVFYFSPPLLSPFHPVLSCSPPLPHSAPSVTSSPPILSASFPLLPSPPLPLLSFVSRLKLPSSSLSSPFPPHHENWPILSPHHQTQRLVPPFFVPPYLSPISFQIVEIEDDGSIRKTTIGPDLAAGQLFHHIIKPNVWFGAFPTLDFDAALKRTARDAGAADTQYSLVGCTVAPAFEFADFELANRADLVAKFPHLADIISILTSP